MSKVLVTSGHLQDIADAIREKNRESTLYRPGDMAAAIQALEGNGYPEPTGSMQITENGTYNVKDVAEAAVNVSAGSVSIDLNYDFTQSMTDTIRNVPIISSNVTQTANGAVYDTASGSYMQLPRRYCANTYTYEVDVGTIEIRSNYHNRVITWNDSRGLIYRSTGKWAFYSGTWQETDITDPTYLNGCTLKVYIDESGYWHIYRNGALWFEPTSACSINDYGSSTVLIRIGSSGNSMGQGTTITGLRAY